MNRKPGIIDALSGYYAVELMHGLCRSGAIDSLKQWITSQELAERHRLDARHVELALEFLARSTDLVRRRRNGYSLTPNYARSGAWRGLLEKFVGAYGASLRAALKPNFAATANKARRAALARAYSWDSESPHVVDTILSLRPRGMLDLGCGHGALLVRVCASQAVRGWDIDLNATMRRRALRAVRQAGLSQTVAILDGDALDVAKLLPKRDRGQIDVIHSGSLLNELFGRPGQVGAFVQRLGRLFPGAWLVAVDYLSCLDEPKAIGGPYTWLTDLTQGFSGQGLPPATHQQWAKLYASAGAQLTHVLESSTTDLRWFIHVVRLGAE